MREKLHSTTWVAAAVALAATDLVVMATNLAAKVINPVVTVTSPVAPKTVTKDVPKVNLNTNP